MNANLRVGVLQRLQKISSVAPEAAIILGSGVNVLHDLNNCSSYSYEEIFGFSPTVQGHTGSLELGTLGNKLIAVLRGRFHLYEGHDFATVTLPTVSLADWGVSRLYLTNAAGAINPNFSVGDLMLITGYRDHLSPDWIEMGGLASILLPITNCENELTRNLWERVKTFQTENTIPRLQRGVYAGVLGPCYETLAEVEMYKKLGADAVGMSTTPELQAAAKTNMQAVAISVITNSWNEAKLHGHLEVLAAAKAASQYLDAILTKAILAP